MHGAIAPLPNTPSWRGAQLRKKHRDNFTFTFIIFFTKLGVIKGLVHIINIILV
jgi:hypothetical protein